MRIAIAISFLAIFVMIGLGAVQVSNLVDETSTTGGLSAFFSRATVIYLLFGAIVAIGGVLALVRWLVGR